MRRSSAGSKWWRQDGFQGHRPQQMVLGAQHPLIHQIVQQPKDFNDADGGVDELGPARRALDGTSRQGVQKLGRKAAEAFRDRWLGSALSPAQAHRQGHGQLLVDR